MVYTSNEYYIDEERKPAKHFMIDSIGDIIKVANIIKETPKPEEEKANKEDEEVKK